MAKLRVTIIDEVRDRRLKVDLPDDAAIEKLLPALTKKLGLPTTEPDGQPIAYRFTHETTGQALGGDQTLASFGVREGDALRLATAKKKLPVWAWVGVVVVVLLAVAALAFWDDIWPESEPTPPVAAKATIPAITSAAPRPTATPVDTPVPPKATPVPTNTPRPTATPVPPTATSAALAATPSPALEPVTFYLRDTEVRQETVAAHQPVIAQWGLGVCKPEVLQDNLDAWTFKVTVDGRVAVTGSMAQYRSEVQEKEDREIGHLWVVYYSYAMGTFESGSLHWLELELQLSQAVSDGCDIDGDGSPDMYGPGYRQIPTMRLEVTVQ